MRGLLFFQRFEHLARGVHGLVREPEQLSHVWRQLLHSDREAQVTRLAGSLLTQ